MVNLKKITIAIIILFLLSSGIYRFFFSDINTIPYEIFKVEKGYILNKILGKVPKKISHGYNIMELESTSEYRLYYIVDTLSPTFYEYYYIKLYQNGEGFLKAPPYYRLRTSLQLELDNYVSGLIDIKLFNAYMMYNKVSSLDSAIQEYLRFLVPRVKKDYLYIQEIKSKEDFENILKLFPKYSHNSFLYDPLIDINNFDLSKSSSTIHYYWIFNVGIVKFNFWFDINKQFNATAKIMGYLGNEAVSM